MSKKQKSSRHNGSAGSETEKTRIAKSARAHRDAGSGNPCETPIAEQAVLLEEAGTQEAGQLAPERRPSRERRQRTSVKQDTQSRLTPTTQQIGASRVRSKAKKRGRSSPRAQSKAGAAADSSHASKPPLKPNRRRRRVKLGDAMRKYGLDEHTIAETYATVVQTLRDKNDGEGIEKLLVDVLKECTRVLEPPPARGAEKSAGDAIVQVQLIHSVPRPERKVVPALPMTRAGKPQPSASENCVPASHAIEHPESLSVSVCGNLQANTAELVSGVDADQEAFRE